MLLSACGKPATTTSVHQDADALAASIEAKADNLEAQANGDANAAVAAMLDGADANMSVPASNADSQAR